MPCRVYKTDEAMKILGVSLRSLDKMEDDGLIHRLKGPGRRYNRRDVLALAGESDDHFRPSDMRSLRKKVEEQANEIKVLKNCLRMIAETAREGSEMDGKA